MEDEPGKCLRGQMGLSDEAFSAQVRPFQAQVDAWVNLGIVIAKQRNHFKDDSVNLSLYSVCPGDLRLQSEAFCLHCKKFLVIPQMVLGELKGL